MQVWLEPNTTLLILHIFELISAPPCTCHQHTCQYKCCYLRTINVTWGAELNNENRLCSSCFLTSMLVITSAISEKIVRRIPKRSWALMSQFGAVRIVSWRPYLSTSLTKQHPGSPLLSTKLSHATFPEPGLYFCIGKDHRMFFVHIESKFKNS